MHSQGYYWRWFQGGRAWFEKQITYNIGFVEGDDELPLSTTEVKSVKGAGRILKIDGVDRIELCGLVGIHLSRRSKLRHKLVIGCAEKTWIGTHD